MTYLPRVPRTNNTFPIIREGLEKAHHALTTLNGLIARDDVDGRNDGDEWGIDETATLQAIEAAQRVLDDYQTALADTIGTITGDLTDIGNVLDDMMPQ